MAKLVIDLTSVFRPGGEYFTATFRAWDGVWEGLRQEIVFQSSAELDAFLKRGLRPEEIERLKLRLEEEGLGWVGVDDDRADCFRILVRPTRA